MSQFKNYLIVVRNNIREQWDVKWDNLTLKEANKIGKTMRADFPNHKIEIWVDIITTKKIAKL